MILAAENLLDYVKRRIGDKAAGRDIWRRICSVDAAGNYDLNLSWGICSMILAAENLLDYVKRRIGDRAAACCLPGETATNTVA